MSSTAIALFCSMAEFRKMAAVKQNSGNFSCKIFLVNER
jgi:hypothetical protein